MTCFSCGGRYRWADWDEHVCSPTLVRQMKGK